MIEEKSSNSPKYIVKRRIIYVATLHSVTETDYSGDIKHQFTYEIEMINKYSM